MLLPCSHHITWVLYTLAVPLKLVVGYKYMHSIGPHVHVPTLLEYVLLMRSTRSASRRVPLPTTDTDTSPVSMLMSTSVTSTLSPEPAYGNTTQQPTYNVYHSQICTG